MPVTLVLDQLTKLVAVERLTLHQPVPVLGDIVRLTYIHNAGAAFGMTLGGPVLHTLVAVGALGILGWMFTHLPPDARWQRTALAMVLGGALGNIIDRVRLNYVIDFIDVGVAPGWRWPVFNVADSFVTVGVVLLALCYARAPRETEAAPQGEEAPPDSGRA